MNAHQLATFGFLLAIGALLLALVPIASLRARQRRLDRWASDLGDYQQYVDHLADAIEARTAALETLRQELADSGVPPEVVGTFEAAYALGHRRGLEAQTTVLGAYAAALDQPIGSGAPL